MEKTAPIETVISKLGSQAKLAEILGKRQSTVAYWAKRSGIPAEAAVTLERVTNGEIPRWVSRPDLWERPDHETEAA